MYVLFETLYNSVLEHPQKNNYCSSQFLFQLLLMKICILMEVGPYVFT
jgi:hypothetical protein